ncbi:high frequency lysogenization protein HflD [Marinomonas mediterranea]|uniref:High frequency lysogenization protein HflD homolog n=1 Tax=Marinomonas mediterranea (strain ATCC 700492 / JCM 21426 / NBRC 103028 / MMB-1) TaxID=717774 RepID=F2JWD7_MARM1|nr:high frequency lysogenization protein HflD [Marinomonas mediterranea]ADZ90610.1 High frequency lysogenization protein hflD [Marinomonas mediterranea MMB-1]WCN08652.1 high frequency lysogenization protein HflD [Marinomonas mediterranea]WCN12707.1 high frequency lysogenization protein HflD [Marinomonas mediterranea]WCN16780.1 high frequency lysogenization protein HflD [Marinomonas mediterranea MMB-1]
MSQQEKHQAIALSAVFQAADLVSQLAKSGGAPREETLPLIKSILTVNANSAEDIYGGQWDYKQNLSLGRRIARQTFGKDRAEVNPETLRYALSLVHLENKLRKYPDMLSAIGNRIQQIERQSEHYEDAMHENVIAGIAGMYQDTLSTLPFRVQVQGDSRFLQQPHVANQVRAILMAGIRASMLWRQLGGKRWHLVFKRKALLKALDA